MRDIKDSEEIMDLIKKKEKKRINIGIFLLVPVMVTAVVLSVYWFMFSESSVNAQAGQDISQKVLTELRREQELLEQEKKRLQEYELNLKKWEAELDRKYSDYLQRLKVLEEREGAFAKRVEDRVVNRQVIETYENIDPEQAAVLIRNLYSKDKWSAVLILRKISGRKAGKILEAMIPLDKETSTLLAKEALDYYKPK
jgi:flagellar motility protein MotE (MotC chaperone)